MNILNKYTYLFLGLLGIAGIVILVFLPDLETEEFNQDVIDEIIQEPLGGAHRDYDKSLKLLGDSIELQLNKLLKLDPQELKIIKQNKYLKIT